MQADVDAPKTEAYHGHCPVDPFDHAGCNRGEKQLRRIERIDATGGVGVERDRCVLRFRETAMRINTAGADVILKHV
jgi:hypothetical protein